MDFNGIRVLVLEGYARQSLPIIRALSKLGCEVSALCSSKLDVAYASRYTKHKIIGVCDREKPEETTRQVEELLKTGRYDLVIPTADFSAEILSKNKVEFSKYAKIASNDWETYRIAGDKEETMRVCMENDIPCPYTILSADSIENILEQDIKFPIVVKPRVGYGAIGFKKVTDVQELTKLFASGEVDIKNSVIQEYIPQTGLQYECAMFVDNRNEVKTALVFSKNRWFPVSGGSSTLNITVKNRDITESCAKLLKKINWRGPADIDLIEDPRDGSFKIMEINPRMSGSVKIAFISGVDQARQLLELHFGETVTEYKDYKEGQRLRCSQTDLLWFIKSKDRFRSNPSWFSIRNTKDHTFYLDDPMPWLCFSIQGLCRYKKESKRRS